MSKQINVIFRTLEYCLFDLKLKESSKDKLNFQGEVRTTVKSSLTVTIMSNESLVSTRDLNPGRQHDEQAPPPQHSTRQPFLINCFECSK